MTVQFAFTDPSDTGPNFLFNNGQVSGATELYDPESSAAPGGDDYTWSVTQWSSDEYFNPTVLSPNIVSPTLGTSIANWATPDGENGFAVFGTPGDYTYQLTDNGGNLKDVYLQTAVDAPASYTFDKQVTFTVDEGIAATVGTFDEGPTSIANSFTVEFNEAGSANYDAKLPTISMFLQFGLANQQGLPGILYGDGMYNVAPNSTNGNEALYFKADGVMHEVTIDLSAGVAQMAEAMYKDQYTTQIQQAGTSILDLSKWSLTGSYIGPEAIGSTGVTLDVAHPVVARDDSVSVTQAEDVSKYQIVAVVGGVNYEGQVDNGTSSTPVASSTPIVSPSTVDDDPVLSGVVASLTVADTSGQQLFPQLDIQDPTSGASMTAVVTLSDVSKGTFDISNLPTELTKFLGISLGDTVSLSADGSTLTIVGSAVTADLRALRLTPAGETSGLTATENVTLAVTNSAGTTTETQTISITGSHIDPAPVVPVPVAPVTPGPAPAYAYNGSYYVLASDSSLTADIDRTSTTAPTTVFGGAAVLDYTGGGAVIVENGAGQTGPVDVDSTTGNFVWSGSGAIDYTSGGHSEIVMADEAGVSGSLDLHGGTASDTNQIDVWTEAGTIQDIVNTSLGATTLYGGGSDMVYSGGNTVVVLNGAAQIGHAAITSTGGNVVWTGTATLDFTEGDGDDTLLLGGSSTTTVHGTTGTTGTTKVVDLGHTGAFVYDGGSKSAEISLNSGPDTVYAGSGTETLSIGGGNVSVVSGSATGVQNVSVAAASGGIFAYQGGSASADLTLGGGGAVVTAGAGNMTLTGGSGSLTLNLQAAASVAASLDGATAGNTDVFGFNPNTTRFDISNVKDDHVGSGGLVLDLQDGKTVTFHGFTSHDGISFG